MSDAVLNNIISAASGLIGAAIGLCGALAVARRAAQAEERRHFRSLGIEVGKAKFEQSMALAQKAADATDRMIPVPSYESHLIHGLRLMEIISDTRLSADEVGRRIAQSVDFTKDMTSAVKKAQDRDAQP